MAENNEQTYNDESVPKEEESVERNNDEFEGDVDVHLDEDEFSCKSFPVDMALVVEGKSIRINRCILAFASPVFDAMFSSNFKEKDTTELILPGKKLHEFVEFLRCLYPHIMKRVTSDNVYKVLHLAHEYQVKHLVSSCEIALIKILSANQSTEDVYKLVITAIKYNLDRLKDKCVKVAASRPFKEIEEAGKTHAFPVDLMNSIKAKLLNNWVDKYKNVFFHVNTTNALIQLLGENSDEQELVSQFENGNVYGDTRTLRLDVNTVFNIDMHLDNVLYRLQFFAKETKPKDTLGYLQMTRQNSRYLLKIKQYTAASTRCICFVKIINWMDRKKSIFKRNEFDLCHTKLNEAEFVLIDTTQLAEISNYPAGYMRDGKLDIKLHLFVRVAGSMK
ncbi:hypothetical protein ACF0H5_023590 [Mactra antiquata]